MGMAGNERCCCCPCGPPGVETHRCPANAYASAVERHAGEQAISASVTTTQRRFLRKQNCAGPRASPREAASRCVCQGRESNPLFPWREVSEIFTTSVGLAARAANRIENKFHSRRSKRRRYREPLKGSLCHRYPASRLVPSDRPRASGHAPAGASPGSGSPVPACAGMFR
jgi:hypothetical protein